MDPGEFLVLAFEEMQEDYRTPDCASIYQGKGKR